MTASVSLWFLSSWMLSSATLCCNTGTLPLISLTRSCNNSIFSPTLASRSVKVWPLWCPIIHLTHTSSSHVSHKPWMVSQCFLHLPSPELFPSITAAAILVFGGFFPVWCLRNTIWLAKHAVCGCKQSLYRVCSKVHLAESYSAVQKLYLKWFSEWFLYLYTVNRVHILGYFVAVYNYESFDFKENQCSRISVFIYFCIKQN